MRKQVIAFMLVGIMSVSGTDLMIDNVQVCASEAENTADTQAEEKEQGAGEIQAEEKEQGVEEIQAEEKEQEADTDNEKPVIYCETLTIDKTETVVGDTVKFSVRATDNREVDRVTISLLNGDNYKPHPYTEMTYNEETGFYEYYLLIDDEFPGGNWRINGIHAYDTAGNTSIVSYLVDKEEGMWDFTVENPNVDSEPQESKIIH